MLLNALHLLAFGSCFITYTMSNAISNDKYHDATRSRYSRAHSLGVDYTFDPRDGWATLNVTDMQSHNKRNLDHDDRSEHQWSDRKQKKKKPMKPSKDLSHLLNPDVLHDGELDSLFHAVGEAEDVIITW